MRLRPRADASAHLLAFDSVHGRWHEDEISASEDRISIRGQDLTHSSLPEPGLVPWDEYGVDIILESTGKFRSTDTLDPYFDAGCKEGNRRGSREGRGTQPCLRGERQPL